MDRDKIRQQVWNRLLIARDHILQYRLRYVIYFSTFLGYLLLNWIVSLLLDPYRNLPIRLILFIFALLPLAFLVRWDDNRVVLFFSFFLFNFLTLFHTFWFPFFYAGITPLFPVFFEYQQFLPFIADYNETGQLLLSIARFGYLVDLIVVLSIAGLISLSSQLYDRLRGSLGRKKILHWLAVSFLVASLILLPYLVIASTGILHFGLAYSSGATQLQFGLEELESSADLNEVYPFFSESAFQYHLAEDLFKGLRDLRVFDLIQLLDPSTQPLIQNGELLIETSFLVADLLLPLLDGLILMEDAINTASVADLSRSQVDQTITTVEQARYDFQSAQTPLKLAVLLIRTINLREFSTAIDDRGLGDFSRELNLIKYSGILFEAALDLLLLQMTPLNRFSFPISHAIEAIYQTRTAQQQIGNDSRFGAVIPTFTSLRSNLSVVELSLDPYLHTEYYDLERLPLGGLDELRNARHQITGLFNFLRDLTTIGLQLSDFGIKVAQSLQLINNSLVPLASDLNDFPYIPSSTLLDGIDILDQVRSNATILQEQAGSIEQQVDQMANNTAAGNYGIFGAQAAEVVRILQSFQLQQNANNFYHLSSACYYLLLGVLELQLFEGYQSEITSNVDAMEADPNNTTLVENSVDQINSTLQAGQISMGFVRANLSLAQYHLNQIENMPEAPMLLNILQSLQERLAVVDAVQTGSLDRLSELINSIGTTLSDEIAADLNNEIQELATFLSDVNGILEEVNIPSGS